MTHHIHPNTFEPQDLACMQKLFSAACAARGMDGKGEAADHLAVRIVALYQQGVREEKDLTSHVQA